MTIRFTSILTLVLFLIPSVALAQWAADGAPVAALQASQTWPAIASDGAGGAIIAFADNRSGTSDIYVQRIDASGALPWGLTFPSGVPVCTAAGDQVIPVIVSDGSGGAIVAWRDARGGIGTEDIYMQDVNSSGAVQWAANGIIICSAAGQQDNSVMIPLTGGGAIIAWEDDRSGTTDIYAQKVNSAGTIQWGAGGTGVCTATNFQYYVCMDSDGSGGALIAWRDARTSVGDIYMQRMGPSAALYTANGVAVCTAVNDQILPSIVGDAYGNAIVAWADGRGVDTDIYAQLINFVGTPAWTANGIPVCAATGNQTFLTMATDGANGAIVAWNDPRNSGSVYAQRIGFAGATQWVQNGVAIATGNVPGTYTPKILADSHSAIVTWFDQRNGSHLYSQRVNASGNVQWTANGVIVGGTTGSTAGFQSTPAVITNMAGGEIVAFEDTRTGNFTDIFAQRIEGTYGLWGRPEPMVTAVADIPHDQGGKVKVNWIASGRDLPTPATISHYSIWRAVDASSVTANATASTPSKRFMKLGPEPYYWELIGTQTATRFPSYSFSAETRADSVLGATGTERFMVTAHDVTDDNIAYASNAMVGHSVDNLAPGAPLFLTAQRAGVNVNLKWNRVRVPDLRDYSVYRKTSSGVTPVPVNFLSSANDTVLVDASAPNTTLYYIVTAYDVHANQSNPSNEAVVTPTTGVGNLPPITALTVLQNHPNPFTRGTELSIGLPASSDINVDVFDVAGRKVSTIAVKQAPAGWQKVSFPGLDSQGHELASGVYFYRVHASGTTVTRKMVITR